MARWVGRDASEAFTNAGHSLSAKTLLGNFCVGNLEVDELYYSPIKDCKGKDSMTYLETYALERYYSYLSKE